MISLDNAFGHGLQPAIATEQVDRSPPRSPLKDDHEFIRSGLESGNHVTLYDRDKVPMDILDVLLGENGETGWRESHLIDGAWMEKCLGSGRTVLTEYVTGINVFLRKLGLPATEICKNPENDRIKLYYVWRVPKEVWETKVAPLRSEFSKPDTRGTLLKQLDESLWEIDDQID